MQRVLVAPNLGHEGLRGMLLKGGKLIFYSSSKFVPVQTSFSSDSLY